MLRLLSLTFRSPPQKRKPQSSLVLPLPPCREEELIVVGAGLLGVFLVLFLFYLTIKLMQKIK